MIWPSKGSSDRCKSLNFNSGNKICDTFEGKEREKFFFLAI